MTETRRRMAALVLAAILATMGASTAWTMFAASDAEAKKSSEVAQS